MTTTNPKLSKYKINSALPWPRIARIVDARDEAEHRALDWVSRFHQSRGIYQLLAIRRGSSAPNIRTLWMLTQSQARRPGARPRWLVIEYLLDEVAITMRPFTTLKAGREAFHR